MATAVIGGSGFIGTSLCRHLESAGQDFIILDKVPSDLYPGRTRIVDIRDFRTLRESLDNTDTVVNLAAEHRDDVLPVSLYQEVNVDGARNICQAAEERQISSIILTSSVAVYGYAPPFTGEDGPFNPFNEYGRTKLEAEGVYRTWSAADSRRRLAIVRPTVVFGEGNRGNVYNLLNQIAARQFIFVGSGTNRKAMAYVGNVSAFLSFLIERPELNGTWNFVDEPIYTMKELVSRVRKTLGLGSGTGIRVPAFLGLIGGWMFDRLADISGQRFPISLVRVSKFMANSSFSAEKLKDTGFQPPFGLQESLEKVLEYEFPEMFHYE